MSDKDLEPTNSKSVSEKDSEQVSGGGAGLHPSSGPIGCRISVWLGRPKQSEIDRIANAFVRTLRTGSVEAVKADIVKKIKDYASCSFFRKINFAAIVSANRKYNDLYIEICPWQ